MAIDKEFTMAETKVDMSASKLLTPLLQEGLAQLDDKYLNPECPVHDLYQCLWDYCQIKDEYGYNQCRVNQWSYKRDYVLKDSGCGPKTGCTIKKKEEGYDKKTARAESRARGDQFMAAISEVEPKIEVDLYDAAMAQQVAAANIAKSYGESVKGILIDYGCDSECLGSVPMDVISVAQAATYFGCQLPANIKNVEAEDLRKRSAPIKQILTKLGVPEYGSDQLNLASTEVIPASNFKTYAGLAAIMTGAYLLKKSMDKKNLEAKDDIFSQLV